MSKKKRTPEELDYKIGEILEAVDDSELVERFDALLRTNRLDDAHRYTLKEARELLDRLEELIDDVRDNIFEIEEATS